MGLSAYRLLGQRAAMDQFSEVGPMFRSYLLSLWNLCSQHLELQEFGLTRNFVHTISPEGEDRVESTTNSNHHQSLHGSPVSVEMTTDTSQELDSMEAGGRIR
jgi:hypothetical protein